MRLIALLVAVVACLVGAAWLNGRDLVVDSPDYAYIPTGI